MSDSLPNDLTEARFLDAGATRAATAAWARTQGETAGVVVLPLWVADIADALASANATVGSVIGWPFGASTAQAKAIDAATAAADGAQELTVFVNLAALKSGLDSLILDEIQGVVDMCAPAGVAVRVALDLSQLAGKERSMLATLAADAGADAIVLIGGGETEVNDLSEIVGDDVAIVVWDPPADIDDDALLEAGAARIARA